MNVFAKQPEMPLGLGMALMKNPDALRNYSKMTYEQKQAIIEHTHSISSKADMEAYVRTLAMQ
ncbi:MAG: hypothetical protein GX488_05530 [Clostridiales bacterium]|nr:hypothetical protein [Clostridiales bacterium]